jgi:hypothetical protein
METGGSLPGRLAAMRRTRVVGMSAVLASTLTRRSHLVLNLNCFCANFLLESNGLAAPGGSPLCFLNPFFGKSLPLGPVQESLS